jgi:hypothetical protein
MARLLYLTVTVDERFNGVDRRRPLEKHGVPFEQAITVFLDPNTLDGPDVEHLFDADVLPNFVAKRGGWESVPDAHQRSPGVKKDVA